ncbi:3-deoxy-D-manno-octulosonic acid transferase [Acinetobacter sp. FNA3]|nr:3-deoxy-D-manno-octulosonic acid transferase [Acinetobacter pollinis]MBF7693376.1 3-deoxy-D-manno-octulosonic acid transferase [Acinetobacter pollinis]MBF7698144.1 3-deoxy-D-manno-octulosonic acid transferase [Acinetobacter pollinis]MBF7701175.1 3-deoxy-D-manno-octulosonic acid transferase [Acinetobacter pollinis]
MRIFSLQPPFWYQLLLHCVQPLYRWRVKKRSNSSSLLADELTQRFGSLAPPLNTNVIWFHAVSVGETNAAQPLIEHYLKQGKNVLVTNTTKTGQARVKSLFVEKYPSSFQAVFLPIDTQSQIEKFLSQYQPKILLLMETELWPNLLAMTAKKGIPQLLLNARLSEKSARGYAKFKRLTQPMLEQLSWIATQDEATYKRFASLGKKTDAMSIVGNIKFDIQPPEQALKQAEALYQDWQLHHRKIIVLASTHADEEKNILNAFIPYFKQDPQLLCVVVPRHPERFDEVYQVIKDLGLNVQRRSSQQSVEKNTQVYLADSMGELWLWYALSQVTYVGGSLNEPGGGHNILEPIAVNVATILGKNYFNFQTLVDEFVSHHAIQVVNSPEEAADVLYRLLENTQQRQEMVKQANKILKKNQGSVLRHIQLIDQFL